MSGSKNLGMPFIEGPEAEYYVTHNEALRVLDTLVQLAVLTRSLSAPPAAPAEGERWIIGPSPTGAWSGRANQVAAWQDGAWQFSVPKAGWLAYAIDEGTLIGWNGSAWGDFFSTVTAVQNLSRLGIGATADATNPLSAKLNNALWAARSVAEGGDGNLRYKLSKESSAKTLSLLLQSNFSGRAELGLTGDDDFRIKVSPDGSTWRDALIVDRSSGAVVADGLTLGRSIVGNALPDSGRFNGNANNNVFAGIAYAAPSYLTALGSMTSHAKFINDNGTYGGPGAALDPEIDALISKIRSAGSRRYGPEWYAVRITQKASGPLVEEQVLASDAYGMAWSNTFTALPARFTAGAYFKVKTGKAAAVMQTRLTVDGVAQSGTRLLTNADGWKYVEWQSSPNVFQYDYRAFNLVLTAGTEVYMAMPRFILGHVLVDPNLGVLMNDKMFG